MRIPSADGFGQVVAEPARPDRRRDVTADSLGAGIGRAVTGIAVDMVQTRRAEEHRAAIEAERTRDAADRATSVRGVHAARDSLAAAHDEFQEGIRTGQIPKGEAATLWQKRVAEIQADAVKDAPAKYLPDMQADIGSQVAHWSRGVTKAVTQRDQSDVRAGLNSTFEAAQRLYMKDPAAANAMVDGAVEQLGPFSGMAPDELARAKQGWAENTRFTKGYTLVNEAKNDNKALAQIEKMLKGDEFAAMDPQRLAQLNTTIAGYQAANIQRAEAAARRAEAERERRLREAEAEYGAASSLVMTGKALSPEYVDRVAKATAGTPYAAALPELLRQAPEKAAFGQQPLAVMDAAVSQARAELNVRGTDPKTEKRLAEMEKIRDQAKRDYAEDPLLAAQERGLLQQVAPVNAGDIPSLLGSLGERVKQAGLVSQQVGQPVSPLLKSEAESVGKALGLLPVDQRSTAIAQLAEAMGPQQAAALGRQMAPKDKALGIALGLAGARTTNGRYTSELVLRGAQAIKDRAVKEDNTALIGVRAKVAAEIGDAYPNEGLRQTMVEASVLISYGLQSDGMDNSPRRAVRLAGGAVEEHNGKKIPLPYGMQKSDFDKRLATLTPEAIGGQVTDGNVYLGGVPMPAAEFIKAVPGARLIHAGTGRYAVQAGNGVATTANGRPIILEVK